MSDPIVIEVLRGGVMESRHHASAVAADGAGAVIAAWGDRDRPTFPRSALKPIQALPLVETGAAEAFDLGAEHLALASASHTGEAAHTSRVAAWLERIGLDASSLECGAHAPTNPDAAAALTRNGLPPSPLHNNCSGKHTGFLTVARHLGLPHQGYVGIDHPVQKLVWAALAEMTGVDSAPWGIDGCGIPTFALPLAGIARGMARMADPDRTAARRIVEAMLAHPHLVAGSARLCTRFMEAAPTIALKGGAEGVYAAIVTERGWGVAVKVEDGAGRAAEAAILAVLVKLGLIPEELARTLSTPVKNVAGRVVGEIRAAIP